MGKLKIKSGDNVRVISGDHKGAEGKIRKALLEQDMLEAVIGLGPNVFYGTQLAACVMVFKQNKGIRIKKTLFLITRWTDFIKNS